jgi:hypothetical protein
VVVFVLIAASLLPLDLDHRLRYSGLILEVLGTLTLAVGVVHKRRLFNRPSFWQDVRSWVSQLPPFGVKQNVVIVIGAGSLSMSGSAAKVQVWRRSDESIESRVAALEANLDTVRTELGETVKNLQEESRNRADAVNSERQARESDNKELRTQLEGLGAEGLALEAIGVFWLIVGVLLSTASSEIAFIVNWLIPITRSI